MSLCLFLGNCKHHRREYRADQVSLISILYRAAKEKVRTGRTASLVTRGGSQFAVLSTQIKPFRLAYREIGGSDEKEGSLVAALSLNPYNLVLSFLPPSFS